MTLMTERLAGQERGGKRKKNEEGGKRAPVNGEGNQAFSQEDTKNTFCKWSQGMVSFWNQTWPKCPKTLGVAVHPGKQGSSSLQPWPTVLWQHRRAGTTAGLAPLVVASAVAIIGLPCLRQIWPFSSVTVPDLHPPFVTTSLSSGAENQIRQDNICRAGAVEPKFAEVERTFLRAGSLCGCVLCLYSPLCSCGQLLLATRWWVRRIFDLTWRSMSYFWYVMCKT